ncbi:MAG: beta-ketoacyl-[acyl-carrier-protein] synthase family protein [archaeon]|jgi:3-oxoacyl-[acyl-carrier-protein] synthase II|nr:beta-ketoacyl-[acyl-carrier-protein] synthase family protein [archaeon]
MLQIVEDTIVVTGIGGISAHGLTSVTMDAMFQGIPGIVHLPEEFSKCETTIGGKIGDIDEILAEFFGERKARNLKRSCAPHALFTLIGAVDALRRAGLITLPIVRFTDEIARRIACFIGTGIGASDLITQIALQYDQLPNPSEETFARANTRLSRMHNLTGLKVLPDAAAYTLSGELNIQGPIDCSIKACATGAGNILRAAMQLSLGFADVAIAGGTEKLSPVDVKVFNTLGPNGALSKNNDHPDQASRPFDQNRDGFVPSEGSWVCVLETLSHAQSRGATILARLSGFGETTDGTGGTDPGIEGQTRAMEMALDMANRQANSVDLVVAHGTSTPNGDPAEIESIKRVFGANREYAIYAPKSTLGHLLGASGSLGAAAAVEAINRGIIPPTINLENPIPEMLLCGIEHSHAADCFLDIPTHPRKTPVKSVLCNSFGFGGQNVCLILEEFAE